MPNKETNIEQPRFKLPIRSIHLGGYFSSDEADMVCRGALQYGLTVSSFIRFNVLESARKILTKKQVMNLAQPAQPESILEEQSHGEDEEE